MRVLVLAACAAVTLAPPAKSQGIRIAADVVSDPGPLYGPVAIASVVGSVGMILTNMDVLQPRMSEQAKGLVGFGVGFLSLMMGVAAPNGDEGLPTANIVAGAMSVATGVFTLVRVSNRESTAAALLAPWLDPQGGTGVRIHFAF